MANDGWSGAGAHSSGSSRCSHPAKDRSHGGTRGADFPMPSATPAEQATPGVARAGREPGRGNSRGAKCLRGSPDDGLGPFAEHDDWPAVVTSDAFELGIRIDGYRMSD